MYFIDPARLPWGASMLVLIAYLVTLVGGYLAGWALLHAQRERELYIALGASGLCAMEFLIVCRRRVAHSGSFLEYHSGHALALGEGKLGWALAATTTGVAIAMAMVSFTLWEEGKRSRS
jgi:hypothetical protein